MKIFDIFKKKKNNQKKKDPIVNDRTVGFEIKFDNSKIKYVKSYEGILKLSIKNSTEIFRQTIKVANEFTFDNSGIYNPHVDIDIMVVRFFKTDNERYFYDITSSDSGYNCMCDISIDSFAEFIWKDLNKLTTIDFYKSKSTLINSQIFDQDIYNSFIGEY